MIMNNYLTAITSLVRLFTTANCKLDEVLASFDLCIKLFHGFCDFYVNPETTGANFGLEIETLA